MYIHDCLILHRDLGELDIHVIGLNCTVTKEKLVHTCVDLIVHSDLGELGIHVIV